MSASECCQEHGKSGRIMPQLRITYPVRSITRESVRCLVSEVASVLTEEVLWPI